MKRKIYLCVIIVTALLTGNPSLVNAQEYTGMGDYWKGNAIADVANTDYDQELYLVNMGHMYNDADEFIFLNVGHHFGVHTEVSDIGIPLSILPYAGRSGEYSIHGPFENTDATNQSNGAGEYLGVVHLTGAYAYNGSNGIFVDRKIMPWTFTPVSGLDNVYTVSTTFLGGPQQSTAWNDGTRRYMVANADDRLVTYSTANPASSNNMYGYWRIVTRQDLLDDFEQTYARTTSPADASFFISSPRFHRVMREEVIVGTDIFKTWTIKPDRGTESTIDLHTGMYPEYERSGQSDDMTYAYAKYYNNRVINAKAGDNYSQVIEIPKGKSGWYRLECQGFFNNPQLDGSLAILFAGITDASGNLNAADEHGTPSFTSVSLLSSHRPTSGTTEAKNQLQAGQHFYNRAYTNRLLVYIPEPAAGEDVTRMRIGIYFPTDMTQIAKTSNGRYEIDEQEDMSAYEWVAFDNFELKYLGYDFILNEDDEEIPHDREHINQTLILKRTFTLNAWNTLTLPISLTKMQFEEAFDSETVTGKAKIAKLTDSAIPSTVWFEELDIDSKAETDIVIEKGKNYLVYPTYRPHHGDYNSVNEYGKEISFTNGDYYIIERVSFTPLTESTKMPEVEGPFSITGSDHQMYIKGTYYDETTMPAGSFALSKGNMYHTKTDASMKGFRCWLYDASEGQTNNNIKVVIGGIEDNTTAIHGLFADEQNATDIIYSINGQKVGTRENLNELPKGVYIINNKKHVVR